MARAEKNGRVWIRCPNGHTLNGSRDMVGTRGHCPKCKTAFTVTKETLRVKKRQPHSKRVQPTRISSKTKPRKSQQEDLHPYSLDRILFHLGDDPVDVRDATQHVFCSGRTGSGKTSTVARLWVLSLLDGEGANAGGFFFCFKNSDREAYLRLIAESGRMSDVIEINIDSDHVFNFLELERAAVGEEAANAGVEMFDSLARVADGGRNNSGGDSFWRFATRTATRNACSALLLADLPLNLPNISRILTSIPHEQELYDEQVQHSSFCVEVMDRIDTKMVAGELSETEQLTYETLGEYFFQEMNCLHQRTKGSIIGGFTNVAASFTTGRFRKLFNGDQNTIRVADAWDQGTLFLIDFNQERHQEVGRLSTSIIRRQIMRDIQRREVDDLDTARLAFTLQDEYARFCDPEFDEQFLATAREKKVACINLLQSVDQLVYVCGSQEKADALLQNHYLKFLLANDGSTAAWNSNLVGKRWDFLEYAGQAMGQVGGGQAGGSKAQVEYLLPQQWHQLKCGGSRDGHLVGCIVFRGGRLFSNGLPYVFVELEQKKRED